MAVWHPAYLLHGDDHDRLAERRSRLRAAAERDVGPEGIEHLSGDASTPQAAAAELAAMTLSLGRRFVLIDGVERWKDAEVKADLLPVLRGLDAATTTVAFVAMEEKRYATPKALITAVEALGGQLVAERALKARDLPRWAVGQAERLGVQLEGSAAQALVAQVGERRVRLERELEKLALEYGRGARISTAEVEGAVADAAQRQVWDFVDAVMNQDRKTAVSAFLALRAQGEAIVRVTAPLASRMRTVLEIARRVEAGENRDTILKSVRMSPWVMDRRITEARRLGVRTLAAGVDRMAELELALRGGSTLDADTETVRVIGALTG